MDPEAFLKTIYLGDRACKGLVFDFWQRRLKLLVDVISRVRDESGLWNYYEAEDIENGYLVFDGIQEVRLDPPGPLPNDYIHRIDVKQAKTGDCALYEFSVSVSSVDAAGSSREVVITALAADCYLEDPQKPGEQVR